jgi:hypothetical protein
MPLTEQQFKQKFSSEAKCVDYLIKLKYGDDPHCPKCKRAITKWAMELAILSCPYLCTYKEGLRVGTIFQKSQLPLMKWFKAIHLISSNFRPLTIPQLRDQVKVSYESAANIKRKITELEKQTCLRTFLDL